MNFEPIQYITQDNDQLSHSEQALAMFRNGIRWVQLRMKDVPDESIVSEANKILAYAREYDATLILNDSVELARQLGVKAVHLGLNDMPLDKARNVLGDDVIIGGTANTIEQIKLQVQRGADYVGVGPFRFTTTKKNLSPTLGLQAYATLLQQMEEAAVNVPLFAVGGITLNDFEDLKKAGVQHFAVSGDLLNRYLMNGNLKEFTKNDL